MKRIIRVFPRKTKATPVDDLVRVNCPPGLFDQADEIHISVSFTWDIPLAEKLEYQWRHVAKTMVGGPALGDPGDCFEAGKYLKEGYTITTRGCPNKCWFCDVWKREGQKLRELPIQPGWNVLDSNILAASMGHFRAVCQMLQRQPEKSQFTGGLEAARLTLEHAEMLRGIRPEALFFAYDTEDDFEPLVEAGKILEQAGFRRQPNGRPSRYLRAYVLIGYPKDTFEGAEKRLRDTIKAGFLPMAMLYRPPKENYSPLPDWKKLQRKWARPAIISHYL